ncbi:MAG: histidinol-phosphate transaminase, partial [candidate division NC10 bacterium]|nr:histidinol-phosphate transaminase [candidate division NC10 bacterium]
REVFRGLLDRGILVRDFGDAPHLRECLRITVGTPEENDAVLRALREGLA